MRTMLVRIGGIIALCSVAALGGCGGGGGGSFSTIGNGVGAGNGATPDTFLSAVTALIAAGSPENTEPVSIDSIAVTTPEDTEPAPII